MAREISNSADILDSRDIEARIDELESEVSDLKDEIEEKEDKLVELQAVESEEAEDEREDLKEQIAEKKDELAELEEELKPLQKFKEEAEGYCEWHSGATLIRDCYFVEYAKQFADDIGAINRDQNWPLNCIDWKEAAEELQQDFTEVDFDGESYWVQTC